MKEYLTIKNNAVAEFTEKRSRFIGTAVSVSSKEDAERIIGDLKTKYWDAKHNVFAYVLKDGNIKRFSDDGEPQGTAGMPVLDVIEKRGLCDVLVVVTRYFGGVLLGTGGLVRAYSHSASIAIDEAGIVNMTPVNVCEVKCDYGVFGAVQSFLNAFGCKEIESTFESDIVVSFSVNQDHMGRFEKEFIELTNGKIEIIKKEEKYLPF